MSGEIRVIRILQIVNIMDRAGLENMLMNYYRVIDKDQVQFDFLTHRPTEGAFDQEIKKLGGNVYRAPRLYPHNYYAYFEFMRRFFLEHSEYRIVHSHIDAMSYLPLLCAKKGHVPIRIAHSHSTSIDINYKYPIKQLFKRLIPTVATDFVACSKEAGEYLFPKENVSIIPNAINISKFFFNEKTRCSVRKKLGIDDKFVVGHVGRFTKAKNHEFLIAVFQRILVEHPNSFLLLVGSGELKENIEKILDEHGLSDKAMILSNRDDVADLYQSMDVFLFPSLYEGLGMGAVEAQVSGLKCFISEKVPRDAKISAETVYLPLDINIWADNINAWIPGKPRHTVYSEYYDSEKAAKKLVQYYLDLSERI